MNKTITHKIKLSAGIIAIAISVIALLIFIGLGIIALIIREQPVKTVYRIETETIYRFVTGMEVNAEIDKIFAKSGHEKVYDFYNKITKGRPDSNEITMNIIHYAIQQDVPISMAFALAFIESRFTPTATNHNEANDTYDYGLFQRNSTNCIGVDPDLLFNVEWNTRITMKDLNMFYYNPDSTSYGDWGAVLAQYNAGNYDPNDKDKGYFFANTVMQKANEYDRLINLEEVF
jgi:soluble lytic murein transglycosylase-like protein